jgi:hypothetical protein
MALGREEALQMPVSYDYVLRGGYYDESDG